tara:strand:- start:693 stop:905 length:213 start_codon:yes stop_codon:yes gene_type:complete
MSEQEKIKERVYRVQGAFAHLMIELQKLDHELDRDMDNSKLGMISISRYLCMDLRLKLKYFNEYVAEDVL